MDRALSRINGPDQDAIAFGREYVSSEAFRSLFRDGMNLIEEASVYLDGEGRQEARQRKAQPVSSATTRRCCGSRRRVFF